MRSVKKIFSYLFPLLLIVLNLNSWAGEKENTSSEIKNNSKEVNVITEGKYTLIKNLPEITFPELKSEKESLIKSKGVKEKKYNIEGYIVRRHLLGDCPPCPKDAFCNPCDLPYILLGEKVNAERDESILFSFVKDNIVKQIQVGKRYKVSFSMKSSGKNFAIFNLLGFAEVESSE